jgi:hypothetical protein
LWFRSLDRISVSKIISDFIIEYSEEMQKPEEERKGSFRKDRLEQTKKLFQRSYDTYNKEFESAFLIKMIHYGLNLKNESEIKSLKDLLAGKSVEEYVYKTLNSTKLFSIESFDELLLNCPKDLDDPLFTFSELLNTDHKHIKEGYYRINRIISNLSSKLYEVKKQWKKTNFIPDANSTFRLTYGYIKGYSPADAVYMSPVTTLEGLIDKSYQGGDYAIPDKLKVLYDQKDFGQFYDDELKSVPIGLLYNMDTTNGNSGSPVMNAYGEIIGINFDRTFEATINDYGWDENYSRSIGVDIRYVLWITQKLGGADYLLKEMGVL